MSDKEIDKLKELVEDCFALIRAQSKLINSQAEELNKPAKVIVKEDKAIQLKYKVLKQEHLSLKKDLFYSIDTINKLQADISCKDRQIKNWTYRMQNTYNGVI